MRIRLIGCIAASLTMLLSDEARSQTTRQFDLSCDGEKEVLAPGVANSSAYSVVIRLDLDAGKWCEGNCARLRDIEGIDAATITLIDTNTDTPSHSFRSVARLDRTTGRYARMDRSGRPPAGNRSSFWTAQCQLKPFSGFPNPEVIF